MDIFDKYLTELNEIGVNAYKYLEELVNTPYYNAWRTATALSLNSYSVIDLIVMFEYLYWLTEDCLEENTHKIDEIENIIFYAQQRFIKALRWNLNIASFSCDNVIKVELEKERFVKLIDSLISYIQNYEI